tara:strand:+ start:40609 stop:41448 length:840 start_codon:yes stop_codon:yes gene_type:complete
MRLADLKEKLLTELKSVLEEREAKNHLAILLEKVLKMNRAQVVLEKDKIIEEAKVNGLNQLVAELKKHKPIDYLFNETVFFGRDFFVDERVLIPRPETEELVQWILEAESNPNLELIDIGSGSGCIPISLALEGNYKLIDACDVSEEANQVARINAKKFGLSMEFEALDILKQIPKRQYDVVVSNPPYVKQEELRILNKNVVEYEPLVALAPEGEPLLFYKRMLAIAPQILKPGGRLFWEIHEDFGKEIVELLQENKFSEIELRQDNYGRDRLVKAVFI